MNLMSFLKAGERHAPRPPAHSQAVVKAAGKARQQWLDALLVDQTRTWMSIGERQPEILSAMAAMLTIAGFCHVHDARSADTPDLRVIRGAISAATQCSASGSVLTVHEANAFRAACDRAADAVRSASIDAILHAATSIRETVGLPA